MKFPTPVFQAPDIPTTPSGGADGGASSVSTPTTTSTTPATDLTSAPSQPDSSSSGVDSSSFEFMFGPEGGDPSEGLDTGLSPSEKTIPEPKPAQPATTPAVTAVEPVKPVQDTVTPAPTEIPSPTPPLAAQPTLDPYDPGTLAQHLSQNEEQVIQQVADTLFKLSDKDVEALESDTVGTIPKLLARAFVASQRNYLMQMARILPTMIQRHGEVTKRHGEAENEFYTRWPDLKKDQHGQQVMQYAAVYRQMHPEASRKDMIEAVGPMVMMAARVTPSGAQAPVQSNVQASPMVNGVRPPQPAPFVPAGPSAGGASLSTAPQPSVYETMFADHDK